VADRGADGDATVVPFRLAPSILPLSNFSSCVFSQDEGLLSGNGCAYAAVLAIWPRRPGPWDTGAVGAWGAIGGADEGAA
jgi:hypothetical protein